MANKKKMGKLVSAKNEISVTEKLGGGYSIEVKVDRKFKALLDEAMALTGHNDMGRLFAEIIRDFAAGIKR